MSIEENRSLVTQLLMASRLNWRQRRDAIRALKRAAAGHGPVPWLVPDTPSKRGRDDHSA